MTFTFGFFKMVNGGYYVHNLTRFNNATYENVEKIIPHLNKNRRPEYKLISIDLIADNGYTSINNYNSYKKWESEQIEQLTRGEIGRKKEKELSEFMKWVEQLKKDYTIREEIEK